jgi:exosome complex RNA-binding protein Rrp4
MNIFQTDTQKWFALERINHKDDIFFVIYKEKEPKGLSNNDITAIREELNCDIVLRANGIIYFCQKIENAEIIEETLNVNN